MAQLINPDECCIYNTVAEFRKEKDITQQDLADAIGVTRQTIISLEKGNYTPSLTLAFKIANFFKTDIHKVFTYYESKPISGNVKLA